VKRSPLERRTPLTSSTPLPRSNLAANQGGHHKPAKRPRNTGPTPLVRRVIAKRSGGDCEWPVCPRAATDIHHRLNRKAGGRRGEMAERINQPSWLLHACRDHHAVVTSPHGEARLMALAMGWLLLEGHEARDVPVVSRHGRVWLLNDGTFTTEPEGSA
jgi:hypothetical protein